MRNLEIQNLSVHFPGNVALDGVSATFRAGEVSLLAGPNGAGKSTLIRVLLGLVAPTHGSIRRDGDGTEIDARFKMSLGYLPEMVSFSEGLSGREVLRFFAHARSVPAGAIGRWLALVGLEHAADRPVRTYSRGMRQRLGLAVACLAEPQLVILDEPTGGLDQSGLRVLWQLLEDFRRDGRIVIIASHDLTAFESRVDKVALLRAGKLLAFDHPTKLREMVALPVSVDIAFDNGVDAAELKRLFAAADFIQEQRGDELCVRLLLRPEELPSLARLPPDIAKQIVRLRVIEAGLDRVYDACMEAWL